MLTGGSCFILTSDDDIHMFLVVRHLKLADEDDGVSEFMCKVGG